MKLGVCSCCKRHIRIDEETCPFCGEATEGVLLRRRVGRPRRASRAAYLMLSAGAWVGAAGCDGEEQKTEEPPMASQPVYGLPVEPEDSPHPLRKAWEPNRWPEAAARWGGPAPRCRCMDSPCSRSPLLGWTPVSRISRTRRSRPRPLCTVSHLRPRTSSYLSQGGALWPKGRRPLLPHTPSRSSSYGNTRGARTRPEGWQRLPSGRDLCCGCRPAPTCPSAVLLPVPASAGPPPQKLVISVRICWTLYGLNVETNHPMVALLPSHSVQSSTIPVP